MTPPLAAGADRAVVRLDSGEYICVDTNSVDALDYLLGWPVEATYRQVFNTFLTPRSVVLDIGANFGLYTATAASVTRRFGRVYAFEGNPHTFALLQRTLYANELFYRSNIVAANLLVSSRQGRGTLYYAEQELGGATMIDAGAAGPGRRAVEVAMTTIDDFLPPDLAVDLVKIDVEGHEPFVMMGMEKTIRRSSNIRLLIEFVEPFLEHTIGAPRFTALIREMGLAICRVPLEGPLELLAAGHELRGAHCCLLTRTPEEDMARVERARRRLPARLKRLIGGLSREWRRCRHAWHRL